MKKVGYLLAFITVVTLSGCGNEKKLICTLEGKDLGKKMVQHMEVSFTKEEVSKVTNKIETTYEDEYKEEIEASYKALEEGLKQYKEEDGIKSKLTRGDDKITVELNFDMKKQKEKSSEASGVNIEASREEVKSDLESQGYTCN